MLSLTDEEQHALAALGQRLRGERLRRNRTQLDFAQRIGTTLPTYRRLESGDPSVSVQLWLRALWVIGRVADLEHVIRPPESLFERLKQEEAAGRRQRARRK